MAHQLFQLPRPTAISNNLTLVAGAKVGFFLTTTSTLTNSYQDSALTTPHTNPVVADSAGRLPAIYLDPSIQYRITFTDANDVEIYPAVDPANDLILTQAIFNAYLALSDPYKRTAAEIAAGVTPTNYAIPSHEVVGYVDPLRYGTNATPGTTNMTTAINAAISVAKQLPNGGTIQLPLGDLLVTGTLALDSNRLHMRGAGMWATRLIFAPTANDTAIELGATGLGDRTSQGSLRDLALWSADATYTKIGIDIIDVSAWDVSNIAIQGDVEVPGVALFWSGGAGSVGIRTRGRELTSIGPLYIYADKPIQISDNPSNSIDVDHFHFHDCTLAANGFPLVTIDTGVNLSDVLFDGYQSWNLGTDGLRWIDTTSALSGLRLRLANVRWEQGSSVSDYLVRIEHNTVLQGLVIDNCYGGLDRSGFYLRKVQNVSLKDSFYTGSTGFVALNVDATVDGLRFDAMYWQTGSTASVVGQRLIYASPPNPSSAALSRDAYYDQTANGDANFRIGTTFSQPFITIANNADSAIGGTAAGALLMICANDGTNAIFSLNGLNHSTNEVADPSGIYSVTQGTPNSHNVYWDAGSSTYRLQNMRGSSFSYKLSLLGTESSF